MMFKGIAHVCYTVKDLSRTIHFYRNVVGLKQTFEFLDNEGKVFGVYFHVGGRNFIELFEGKSSSLRKTESLRHLCLEVDDIKAMVKKFGEHGIKVTSPKMGIDGSWQAWLYDPDGNLIELHQYTEESKQEVALQSIYLRISS